MPVWLLKFWKFVKGVPTWAWGVLITAGMFVAMYLRMRSAERAAHVAVGKAAVSKMKAATAKNDAKIEVELAKIETLAKERTEIREATADEIAAIEDMTDDELAVWLKNDAQRRLAAQKKGGRTP